MCSLFLRNISAGRCG
ncbi:hypothetical protein [Escherichia coli]|nr:hypothetical protein [Escherichia coli]